MRRLRGGTWTVPVHAMTSHNLNGLFFSTTTDARRFLQLSVELLIFPNFKAFSHELFKQTNRIPTSQPRGFLKTFPQRGIYNLFSHVWYSTTSAEQRNELAQAARIRS